MSDLNEKAEKIESKENNNKNYLEFKTEQEFKDFFKKEFEKKEKEIKEIKIKNESILNEKNKLDNIINNFTNSILKKYNVENNSIKFENLKFDNLDEFEKSILKDLEKNNIKIKSDNFENKNENKKLEKLLYF